MCTHTKRTPLVTVGTPPGHVPHYDDAISIASIEGSVTEPESDNRNDTTAESLCLKLRFSHGFTNKRM